MKPTRRSQDPKTTGLTPRERIAELHKAAILRDISLTQVVRDVFKCSYSHYRFVISGQRRVGIPLARRIADFAQVSLNEFWGDDAFYSKEVKEDN